jgi:hypothetical protein
MMAYSGAKNKSDSDEDEMFQALFKCFKSYWTTRPSRSIGINAALPVKALSGNPSAKW